MSRRVFLYSLVALSWTRPADAAELLVFDWNKPVPASLRGFPWDSPPMNGVNGDWTTPVDYANGTLYYRVEIRSQPVAQDMNLQFCFWQAVPDRESCGPHQAVKGTPGVMVTWSCDVQKMWKKDDLPIEWTQPRDRNGVAIKDDTFQCVSDYSGWNWNGHDPSDWYPLDLRFTVVVVSKGSTFSGWTTYIDPPKPPDAGAPDAKVGVDAGVVADISARADRGAGDVRPTTESGGNPARDLAGGCGCSAGPEEIPWRAGGPILIALAALAARWRRP
jgi:MYXO-CTERM domain-containing protein